MARKCTRKSCRKELPTKANSDKWQERGFCDDYCMAGHGNDKAVAARERAQATERRKARADRAAERKAYNAAKKAIKEKLKTLSDHVSETQTLVNQIVVLEDKPKGCISCDNGEVEHSGHYFHRGNKYRVSPITLDRRNLNGQCVSCNAFQGGKQHEYRIKFIERYGQAQFDDLCEYKRQVDRGEIPKLTVDQCKQIQTWARKRIKELKAG